MINISDILEIHEKFIDEYGGIKGIRSIELLESALNSLFLTFDKKDLYPSATEKSCILLMGIIQNHPFIDGNKRIHITLLGASY